MRRTCRGLPKRYDRGRKHDGIRRMQKRTKSAVGRGGITILAAIILVFTLSGPDKGAVKAGGCSGPASAEAGWVSPTDGTPTGCNRS